MLTVAGLIWRCVGLDCEGLWNDELFTAHAARLGSIGDVVGMVREDVHPPLYFVFMWLWAHVFLDSEIALRAPSVIFGALTISAVYALGRRMLGWKTGILAAVFAAVLYTPWYQSQEARAYSLALLLSALAGYFAFGIVDALRTGSPPRVKDLLGFMAVGTVLAYTHYFGLLLIALMGISLITMAMLRKTGVAAVWGVLAAMIAFYAPWFSAMAHQLQRKETYIKPPSLRTFDEAAGILFNSFSGMQALLIALAIAAFVRYRRIGENRGSGVAPEALLFLWILVPMLLAVAKSFVGTPIFTPKNMIVTLPAALVLLGRMCELLSPRFVVQASFAAGLALASLGSDLYFSGQFSRSTREQFREATAFVLENPDSAADCHAVEWDYRNFDYYWLRDLRSDAPLLVRIDRIAVENDDVAAISGEKEKFWLLDGDFEIPDSTYRAIELRYESLKTATFYGVGVTLYRRKEMIAAPPESAKRGPSR